MNLLLKLSIPMLLLLSGCNGDYETPLPGGFLLARTNADTKAIFVKDGKDHPSDCTGGVAVAAYVDQMAVDRTWVIGYVTSSPASELAAFEAPGYFLLNTTTGEVETKLDKDKWQNRLRQVGIDPAIRLRSP